MKDYYYWSLVIAAVLALLISMTFSLLVLFTPYAPTWMVVVFAVLTLYVVVGAFIQGRDRNY